MAFVTPVDLFSSIVSFKFDYFKLVLLEIGAKPVANEATSSSDSDFFKICLRAIRGSLLSKTATAVLGSNTTRKSFLLFHLLPLNRIVRRTFPLKASWPFQDLPQDFEL